MAINTFLLFGVTSQANATGGCDTPILLSGGVDTKLHVWDCREVLYDLNWSRRCHFCMFLCVYNLLDRSDAVIRPKKLGKSTERGPKTDWIGTQNERSVCYSTTKSKRFFFFFFFFPSSCSYSLRMQVWLEEAQY